MIIVDLVILLSGISQIFTASKSEVQFSYFTPATKATTNPETLPHSVGPNHGGHCKRAAQMPGIGQNRHRAELHKEKHRETYSHNFTYSYMQKAELADFPCSKPPQLAQSGQ